jgi:streptogramin lyase
MSCLGTVRHEVSYYPLLLVATVTLVVVAAGCGGSEMTPASSSPVSTPVAAFLGAMRSGTSPVGGATISLYAAGTSGAGAGAINLLPGSTITTDALGHFSVPAFQCPASSSQVYLVGRGGMASPTPGSDNSALAMMAALGDCGSITNSTTVMMNEVTTAASVWALAQFLAPGATVGASSTNANGLRNAFLAVDNLVDNTQGSAPGPSLPANTLLETAKLNSLADILWACDQSVDGSACKSLFDATTAGATTPANTLDAALAIVRNPGASVAAIFALQSSGPYQPALTAAPHDWTLSATFGNCASGCGGLDLPGSLAIDSGGNVWVANYFGGATSKFSPTGVPAAANGFLAPGIDASFGIAVDAQDSVWITNEYGTSAAGTARGSITHLSSTGQNLSGAGYTGGGIYYPLAVAATSTGDVWVADYANAAASLLASDGTAISAAGGDAAAALPFTSAVAVDGNQNGWFVFQGGVARVTPANGVSSFSCCNEPAGIAIDAPGNIWVADYGSSSVVELAPSGAILAQTSASGGLNSPVGIAVDGSGNVWIANYQGNSLTELNGATMQTMSPGTGYGFDAPLLEPFGIGIDASGNVWTSNAGSSTLTEFVGAASPVKTPLLGAPTQP